MSVTPTDRPRWRRRLIIAVTIVVLAIGGVVAALPMLVDSAVVQRTLERQISALAGGDVRYEALSLSLFPRPLAEIRNATVGIPGTVEGRIPILRIGIALLPLLTRDVRVTSIRAEQPVFELRIVPGGGGDPFVAYRATLGPVVDALVRDARGMTLAIVGGRLDISYSGRRVASISDLAAEVDVSSDAIDASVHGAADLWRAVDAHLRIASGSLAATAKLKVTALNTATLVDALRTESAVALRAGTFDGTLDGETDGRSTLHAALTAAAPQLSVARGAGVLELGAVRVTADVVRDTQALTLTLRALQLGELVPGATGSLTAKPDGAAPTFALQVPALDLARLRDAALALSGDLDAVRAAAATVTAGTARGLTVSIAGDDLAALAQLPSVRAEAQLEAATVALPTGGITVTNGAGRFVLDKSALQASAFAGAIGSSSFSAGTFAIALLPEASLSSLQAAVDADLAEALAIARRVLGRRGDAALADIESLRGRASGRVEYELQRGHPRFSVDATSIRATSRHRAVPFPLEVTQGELHYSDDRLVLRRLAGRVGRSRVQGVAAELRLGARTEMRAANADVVLVLDEIYPWAASHGALRTALEGVKSATGTAAVHVARWSGSFAAPEAIDFEVAIKPQQVLLTGPALPAPLSLAGGVAIVTRGTLTLDRLEASMLDARATLSGTVTDYASSDPRFDLAVADGSAGQQGLDWARTRWQLPVKAMPRAPVGLAAGRVQWPGAGRGPLLAQGSVSFPGGPRAQFDLAWQPNSLDLRRLTLKDADSDATASLHWAPGHAELAFNGRADNRTAVRILASPPALQGSIQGNLRATIDLREPLRSTAAGTLEAAGVDILEWWGVPVVIDRLSIDASGDPVRIRDSALRVAGERLALSGTVERGPASFAIDAHITADRIDAARLLAALPRGGPPGAAWNLPVEGRVTLDAKSVVYGERVIEPVVATATLAPNRVVADVTDARLCGIQTPFNAVLAPGSVNVSSRITARNQSVEQAVRCLFGDRIALTGTFDLDAELAASGPPDALLRAVRGSYTWTARAGRLEHDSLITRILSLDNVTQLLRARPSDLMAGGLPFTEIIVTGTLEDRRVRIERGSFDSPSLGIGLRGEVDLANETLALQGIVAPFGNVNAVVRRIPLVGRVFGTRLVGIPISVTGPVSDPRVLPLGPSAVGEALVNLMTATFKAPIDLFDPFIGRAQPGP